MKSNQSKPPRPMKPSLRVPSATFNIHVCITQNMLLHDLGLVFIKVSEDLQRTVHDECTRKYTNLASRSFYGYLLPSHSSVG